MAATIIDGTRIAEQIRSEVAEGVEEMRDISTASSQDSPWC